MSDVPSATVVQDGKLGGDVPKGERRCAGRPRTPYKRKLSNYLLDKKLQLRYVLLVTMLSGVISGSLGYLIYQQRHAASSRSSATSRRSPQDDKSLEDFQEQVAAGMAAEDRALVYKMVGVGIGLVVILSLYLVIMTHKVAGPLYKVSMYFDRMAEGRLGNVTRAYDEGDMLQDFFGNFREMHDAVRTRSAADVITLESAAIALRAKATGDGPSSPRRSTRSTSTHAAQEAAALAHATSNRVNRDAMTALLELGDRYWALGLPAAAKSALARALAASDDAAPALRLTDDRARAGRRAGRAHVREPRRRSARPVRRRRSCSAARSSRPARSRRRGCRCSAALDSPKLSAVGSRARAPRAVARGRRAGRRAGCSGAGGGRVRGGDHRGAEGAAPSSALVEEIAAAVVAHGRARRRDGEHSTRVRGQAGHQLCLRGACSRRGRPPATRASPTR